MKLPFDNSKLEIEVMTSGFTLKYLYSLNNVYELLCFHLKLIQNASNEPKVELVLFKLKFLNFPPCLLFQ